MANSLLTIDMITREAVRLFKNSNEFIQNIDTQYDSNFAEPGAKIGTRVRIRLPNDYTVRTGAAAQPQDTTEQFTSLPLSTQKGVDVEFSSLDRTLSLDDFSERVLAPMMNDLVGGVALDVMSGVEGGICNFVANTDANGNIITPNLQTFLNAGAAMDRNSARRGRGLRKMILSESTNARTVGVLSGLFNPDERISQQYEDGMMERAIGFDWFMDQTTLNHVTGAYTGTGSPALIAGTVAGASQTGLSLVVSALAGPLAIGDIVTLGTAGGTGVNAVNRVTKQSTGVFRQFVITANAAAGATALSIYPAIVPPVGGQPVQYQTVDSSPANGANINVVSLTASSYRKNFAFVPEAITMASADLELPKGVHEASRAQMDGISMRMLSQYWGPTDQFITRLDVLYGYLFVKPEWAVIVADAV